MSKPLSERSLIPQAFIDDLLQRTDLVELIDSYIPLKKRGNSFIACCPFHSEKTPSFNVVSQKQFYHCFGCGSSGNAVSFVMNYLNQHFPDAIETLAARVGMEVPRTQDFQKNKAVLNLYQLLHRVSDFYQKTLKNNAPEAISYLRNRGVSGSIAKRFQLGYAHSAWQTLEAQFRQHKEALITTGMLILKEDGKSYDRYRHRIIFPIHDRHGRIIGFGGRAIDSDQKPKYLNSPETPIFQKNRELYGLHQVLQHAGNSDNILIVEGYLDVIALAQYGINNAVATLGTATSHFHIQLLSKYTKQIIFCFDGDEAGKRAAWKALENTLPLLDSDLDARFIFLPDGHDPDSLVRAEGTEAFTTRVANAQQLSHYFLDTLTHNLDVHSVAGKNQLINAVKPYLQRMPDGTYKQLIINELSRITRIENHRITQLVLSPSSVSTTPTLNKPISRSPIRLAIALLIQNPSFYTLYNDAINIEDLDGDGQETLQKILKQIAENPKVNTASIIELWRNTPLFDSLLKLAVWEHNVPPEALAKEFIDNLRFLQKQNLENKINQFIAKSRKQGLTVSEQLVLQDMLKQKH